MANDTEEITTVPELLSAIGDLGSLQSKIEIYDVSGNRYDLVTVYLPDDEIDDAKNVICFDIRKRD